LENIQIRATIWKKLYIMQNVTTPKKGIVVAP